MASFLYAQASSCLPRKEAAVWISLISTSRAGGCAFWFSGVCTEMTQPTRSPSLMIGMAQLTK